MTKIPPLEIFTRFDTDSYELDQELTKDKLKAILNKNSFTGEIETGCKNIITGKMNCE